jgi:hypothetical protein
MAATINIFAAGRTRNLLCDEKDEKAAMRSVRLRFRAAALTSGRTHCTVLDSGSGIFEPITAQVRQLY